jgi:hypothetical protein
MPPNASPIIAPLSLSNALTVLCALLCLWTASPQASGGDWRLWRLAVPGAFAALVALMLLAGVFDATWPHDLEWVGALVVGSVIGRIRGSNLPIQVVPDRTLVRLPRSIDGSVAAVGVVLTSLVDFTSATLRTPIVETQHVASAAALCAGFLGCKALVLILRSRRALRATTANAAWTLKPGTHGDTFKDDRH